MSRIEYPIRVLQIIGNVCGGGVESVILNYYRNIDRTKIQFDFVVDGQGLENFDLEVKKMGGKIYHITPYQKNIFKYMYQIFTIVKNNKYLIVHSNMNTLSFFSLMPAFLAGAKIRILHNHSTAVKSEILRSFLKYILRPFAPVFANRFLACSRVAGEWMYGKKKMRNNEIKILNNAIDLNRYAFNPEMRTKYRKELGINSDTFVIGHVGRFMYQKNHDFIIDVFNELLKKKPNSKLLLIGDGPLQNKIKNKVNTLNLNQNVIFLGLRSDVSLLYSLMDVFVLPSWYEGLPVVSVEAQANGLPCVFSTNVTMESKLTPYVDFIDLNDSNDVWCDKIISYENIRNNNALPELRDAGFDISNMSLKVGNWYQELFKSVD